MECPKEIRQCPHNWTDCNLCANRIACKNGTYEPASELEEDELTTDLGIVIVEVEAVYPFRAVERATWVDKLNGMTEDERWAEYYKYHPEDLISKEPITCLSGPVVPGGGSKNKVKKSKTGNKVFTDEWTGY